MSPIACPNQSGIAFVAVLVFLLVIAAAVALRGGEEIADIKIAAANAEARRVDYVAQAGMQRALWTVHENACSGAVTIPTTNLDGDTYSATITGGGTTTAYTLLADQDTWITSGGATTNMGGDTDLIIEFDAGDLSYALYRFDLSGLPAGARVNSASAEFYLENGGAHPEGPLTVHAVTADWTEGGATWDNMNGNFAGEMLAMIPAQSEPGVWVSINLTGQLQAWVNGEPNYGILIATASEGVRARYNSREDGTNPPRLEVVVGNASPSPLNIQATGTLANGKSLQLSRPTAPAYQPPAAMTLQLGSDPGEDAMPDSFYSARNYGGATYVQIHDNGTDWQQYPLIRFDLGRLPRGAAVQSAQLELHMRNLNTPGTATVHQVTRSWVEGTKAGGGIADGSTWFTHDGTNLWGSAGGDFNAAAVAETAIDGSETWVSWDIAPLVERWLAGEPNYGLMLRPANGLRQANFSSQEDSDISFAPKLTIEYGCECGSACMTPQGKGTILMAVVNPTTLVPADELKKALFESWGYTVKVISESANQTAYDVEMAGADVVFISETVNSNGLGTKLQNAPIGVVSQDGKYNADLGFAAGSAWPVGPTVEIADTDHYITRPFAAGPRDIYAAGMELLTVSGSVAPDARLLANAGGAGALVTLDAGAMGSGGAPVPARRAMLPLGRDANLSWDYLTSDGLLLVQRTIAWAMGADITNIGNVLLVVTDPGSLTAGEAAKQALIEGFGFTVNLIDAGANQGQFDTAIAANDVAYIPQEINATTLGTKLVDASIGVVNEEGEQVDELGFAAGPLFKSRREIDVLDNSHYITQPFATGLLTFSSSDQSVHMLSGQIAPGLQTLGQSLNTGSLWAPSLATLDPGDELSGGGNAAGRRVQLPWGGGTFDITQLTVDGQTIMQRALEWGATVAPPPQLLMVVGDPAALTASESGTRTLIESWAYVVNLIDDDDTQASFDAAVSLADVAFITSDIDAGMLTTKLTDATIGIVVEEHQSWADLELCSDRAGSGSTLVNIIDNTHYITNPYSTGSLTILTSASDIMHCTASVAAGVVSLIEESGSGADPGLLTLDTGALRLDGQPSTGRRVTTPWGGNWDATKLNSEGQTILRRSIEWAAAGAGGPPPSQTVLLVSGDAAAPPAKDTGMETLMTGWGFTVDWIDDGDIQANFDTQMAAADVVYVSGTIDNGTLGNKVTGVNKGVVNEFAGKLGTFGFSSGTSLLALGDGFTKTDPAHYITEPFGGEAVTAFSAFAAMPVPSGTLAPDLQLAGAVSGSPALVTLAAGATRFDGNPAPARRAHLPFTNVASTDLTADGETILERTIRWAAGEGADAGSGGGGGPTGIVFEEFTERKYGSTTFVENDKPPGTTEGDLLIATVATDGSTAGSMSPPAGWTPVDLADQGGAVTYGVWWKLAGASEPATYTFSWSGSEHAYSTIMRFAGHDPADPIDVSAAAGGSSSAPTSPAVTTTVADTMILRLGGFDDDDIDQDVTGLTGHTTITMDDSGNGPATTSSGAGYVLQPAAGDSGTSTFALTGSEQYRTVTLAIAPAP